MAQYNFDDNGNMAAYFVITLLLLVLVPATLSLNPGKNTRKGTVSCECPECVQQQKKREKSFVRRILMPKITLKGSAMALGWIAVAGLAYYISNIHIETKLYDPFEILGIRQGSTEKEIKRHWRKLSLKFHPDKVKLAVNQTMEEVASKYVEFTKAYKSLTDETIRKNLEDYGHPDGRQEMTVGMPIPKYIVEGATGLYFLLGYSLLLGGSLPFIVGRWWFKSRAYTKDGVHAKSAENFFKRVKEDSSSEDVFNALAVAWQFEAFSSKRVIGDAELKRLEKVLKPKVEVGALAAENGFIVKRTLILLYAHLTRTPIQDKKLRKELNELLAHSHVLLASLLNVTLARNWLAVSIYVMQAQARLVQAVKPSRTPAHDYLQYPSIKLEEAQALADSIKKYKKGPEIDVITALVKKLEETDDARATIVKKAAESWCRLDIVDASFTVIGDKIITPGSFVNLVIKLRVAPPGAPSSTTEENKNDSSDVNKAKDERFLLGREESEPLQPGSCVPLAHAPYWPGPRRPQWWVVIGDDKIGRVIVPPLRVGDVPYSDKTKERNYRTWKTTFQAPPQVGVYTWRLRFISDTFLGGDDYTRELTLKVEDASLLDTVDPKEDEISDPEEDSIAGQLAAARGQKVKKAVREDSDDDDESGTDEEEDSSSDSSSDSDSD